MDNAPAGLPIIATFRHYEADHVTLVSRGVHAIHTQVRKLENGCWEWHVAILLAAPGGTPDPYIRRQGVAPRRKDAIRRAQVEVMTMFDEIVPPEATLRIGRGEEKPLGGVT